MTALHAPLLHKSSPVPSLFIGRMFSSSPLFSPVTPRQLTCSSQCQRWQVCPKAWDGPAFLTWVSCLASGSCLHWFCECNFWWLVAWETCSLRQGLEAFMLLCPTPALEASSPWRTSRPTRVCRYYCLCRFWEHPPASSLPDSCPLRRQPCPSGNWRFCGKPR